MRTMQNAGWALLLLLGLSFGLVACGGEDPNGGANQQAAIHPALPSSSWSAAELGPARPAGEVKQAAQSGDEVVVSGRVKDFVNGLAAFTLIDKKLRSCAEREHDNCPTPWDYCCEASSDIKDNLVTVEFRDGRRPYKGSIKGWNGLDHLQEIVVKGAVDRDSAGNVIVIAETMRRLD